ncbi:SsgA family sporulation/cell division regulator [Streptomyces albus]
MCPCGQRRTVVELHAGEGVAVLEFPSAELGAFLRATYDLVPAGAEGALLDLEEGFARPCCAACDRTASDSTAGQGPVRVRPVRRVMAGRRATVRRARTGRRVTERRPAARRT